MRATSLPALNAFQLNVTTAGTVEQIWCKIRGTTIAFNNNSATGEADTITDSGNAFITSGFRAGDMITVSGATNSGNNSTFHVSTVAAGTLTLSRSGVLTTEAAGATVRVVAPKVIPDGISVTVKAKAGNTGNIYISDASTGATSGAGFVLAPSQSLSLQVRTTDLIYVDAATSGEGVEVIFERNLAS